MVRAKFRVNEVIERRTDHDNGAPAVTVSLLPVSKSEAGENAMFGKYTPAGSINMTIYNPEASNQFEPGKSYYVDFTPAD